MNKVNMGQRCNCNNEFLVSKWVGHATYDVSTTVFHSILICELDYRPNCLYVLHK